MEGAAWMGLAALIEAEAEALGLLTKGRRGAENNRPGERKSDDIVTTC